MRDAFNKRGRDKNVPVLSAAKLAWTLGLSAVGVALIVLLALGVGSGPPGLWQSLRVLVGQLALLDLGHGQASTDSAIVAMRSTRVLLGFFAGAGLAGVGAVLQLLLRNPLADPYVVGVSGGAALGGSLAIIILGQGLWVAPLAFVGAALASFLTLGAARVRGRSADLSVLLVGVVVNAFAAALITLIKTLVAAEKAQEVLFWLVGFIDYARPLNVWIVAIGVLLALGVLQWLSPKLYLMSLGEDSAARLGVDVDRTLIIALAATSLATGVVVSQTGMIGFIGLIVPHALRLVLGPDPRLLVPLSALIGGAALVMMDALTRGLFRVFYSEVPVGALCALIGAPIFIYLLRRALKEQQL